VPEDPGERRRVKDELIDAVARGVRAYGPAAVGKLVDGFASTTVWVVRGVAVIGVTALASVTFHLSPVTVFNHSPAPLPFPIGKNPTGDTTEGRKTVVDQLEGYMTYIEPASIKKFTITVICPLRRVARVVVACVYVLAPVVMPGGEAARRSAGAGRRGRWRIAGQRRGAAALEAATFGICPRPGLAARA
jgi:hypothetical protein